MAFTVQDFRDLVALLEQRPEWRAELRRLVLTEELLALPDIMRELVEAQRRTEQQLAVVQQQIAELVAAQQRTEQQIAVLVANQRHIDQRLDRLEDHVGELKGFGLEGRYRQHPGAYFGQIVRRAYVLSGNECSALLEDAVDHGQLSDEAMHDVSLADILVRGRHRERGTETYLVVEVSWGIGPYDVERATRRAALLAQTGAETMPVVAGQSITAEAAELARAMRVWQVLDGRIVAPV